jgi:fucose permease
VGLSVLAALCFASEGAVGDWSGVYLNTVVGTDEAWATTGYAAFALAMVAGRLAGDAVVRRLGPERTLRYGALLALLGLAVALSASNRWLADAGFVLVGAGLANVVPAAFSAAGRVAGTGGVAMVSWTGYAGLLIAPPVLGNVADAVGLRLALVLVIVGIGAIGALAGAVRPTGGE